MGQADGAKKEPAYYYPWSLVYDIDLTASDPDEWVPCKVFDNWKPGTHFDIDPATGDCPFGPHHQNTICPYGFWGFKHIIEIPI